MQTQADIAIAYEQGRFLTRSFNKNVTVNTTTGVAQDLSGVSGNPIAQYFLGASGTSTALSYLNNDKGLDHGGTKTGFRKFLHKVTLQTPIAGLTPSVLELYDYLLFYPFIGMDSGLQTLTNTVPRPRYSSAVGVQMMLIEQNPYAGGATVRIGYTNQDGVAGRLTPIITLNAITPAGTVATSSPTQLGASGDLLPLQQGDTGVTQVDTIEFLTADIGTVCVCLVKPITSLYLYEPFSPCMYDLWFHNNELPEIENDAYLNFVLKPSRTLTGAVSNTITGSMTTIWTPIT